MKIFICESEFPTHYHFIQHLLPAFSRQFEQVVVGVMESADSDPHYLSTIKHYEKLPNVQVLKTFETVPTITDTQTRQLKRISVRAQNFRYIEQYVEQHHVDHLIVLSGDMLIPLMAEFISSTPKSRFAQTKLHIGVHWLMPLQLSSQGNVSAVFNDNLVNKEKENNLHINNHQRQIEALLKISPKSLMFQNILALEKFQKYFPELYQNCYLNPVPIEVFKPVEKEKARAYFDIPIEGRLIGFTGSIQKRKGIPLFLEAFKSAPLKQTDRALLIGPFDDYEIQGLVSLEYQDLVDEGRLIIRNKTMDAHSLHMAISSFDVLICNITKHQWSSDMALRAMVAEVPILVSDEEWFKYMVSEFRIGETIPKPHNPKNVAIHIVKSLAGSSDYLPSLESRKIVAFNQPENYAATLIAAVTGSLNSGELGKIVQWPTNSILPTS